MQRVTALVFGLCLIVLLAGACSGQDDVAQPSAVTPAVPTEVAATASHEPGERLRSASVGWDSVLLNGSPTSITLSFTGGAVGDLDDHPCAGEYETEVTETAEAVHITIYARVLEGAQPVQCLLLGYGREITVELDQPIAGRSIIDGHDETTKLAADPSLQGTAPPGIPDAVTPENAWSAVESTRDVANYLEALRQGAYEQAAWPAYGNGILFDGQSPDETGAEFLARSCGVDLCNGPYLVRGQAGVLSPVTGQGLASVTVAHLEAGARTVIFLVTFEGQRLVGVVPPLVASNNEASFQESLFGNTPPKHVVVERFDAFEIWNSGSTTWVTNWHAAQAAQIEGDVVGTSSGAFGVGDPQQIVSEVCAQLMERNGDVLILKGCGAGPWEYTNLSTGAAVDPPIPHQELGDGESLWFAERGGSVLIGQRDGEGNLQELTTLDGPDLLAGDYASQVVMSADGVHVAYVDHRDPAASSLFWSPIVVVRNVTTGAEAGRWELNGSVVCLDFAVDWIIACEADDETLASGDPDQAALVAVNLTTGELNRVNTGTRVFLPSIPPTPDS